MKRMTKNAAIGAGLSVLPQNEDITLAADIKETMKLCGYEFNEVVEDEIDESQLTLDTTVKELVKAFNKNMPVLISILPGSEIAKKYPRARQYDYVNGQPYADVKVTKGIKTDAPAKERIKPSRKLDEETQSNKPVAPVADKSAWTTPAAKETAATINNDVKVENKKENVTMKTTTVEKIEKALEKTEDKAMAAVMETAKNLGADTSKKFFAPIGVTTAGKTATTGEPAKKRVSLSTSKMAVAANAFWYRNVDGLDGINPENAAVDPYTKKVDNTIFKYRVRFEEPVLGISYMDFYKSKITDVLYNVDVKVPGLPVNKGFKVRYTKAMNGALTIFEPSFKAGEKDGKPVYYGHIALRDKEGKLYEDCVPYAAAILCVAEAVMEIEGLTTSSDEDDDE